MHKSLVCFCGVFFCISQLYAQKKIQTASIPKCNTNTAYKVNSRYTDEATGIEYIYTQQVYNGFPVYNKIKASGYKKGVLQYSSGNFINSIEKKVNATAATVNAEEAIYATAAFLKLQQPKLQLVNTIKDAYNNKLIFSDPDISKEPITAEQVWYVNDDETKVQLAWNIEIAPKGTSDYFHFRIDALNTAVLDKGNYTVHERPISFKRNKPVCTPNANKQLIPTQKMGISNATMLLPPLNSVTASYNVIPYPYENRFVGGISVQNDPWLLAGVGNNATTYGWHYNGTTNFINTRGNNVYAYDDSANVNKPGRPDTATVSGSNLSFIYTPNFNKQPSYPQNRQFAVANLFYWNNIMHDLSYQYGFTEAAGNFQNNNLGRGGTQGDYVRAEAQDGSGTDNANFSTLPDGQTVRMQMYLFSPVKSQMTIQSPSSIAGGYLFSESGFSTANKLSDVGTINGEVVLFNDDAAGTSHLACSNAANASSLKGKIVLINRGTCSFVIKVKNAQNAGAIGVIVYNNLADAALVTMSGTDNTITIPAVFITMEDGERIANQIAIKQVVKCTINSSVGFDGDLDNGVVAHEYTHGISNRLTGGPTTTSCLSNKEEGGEGWSDYVALMATTDWSKAQLTDGAKIRHMGSYLSDQDASYKSGFRFYPYSTDMSINPHTYHNLRDTLYGDTTFIGEVHYIGEVWCSALWDMTWNIIQQDGVINPNLYDAASGQGGNTKALQLVMTGMKLQPCSPGFLDARNAILAADSILYAGTYKCAIWKAFAQRGMGYSAKQGSNNKCGDETDAYDVAPACGNLPVKLIAFSAMPLSGKVFISWQTAEEINIKQFVVEHAYGNAGWENLQAANATNNGLGNSYSAYHNQPLGGVHYFRLKIIESNGTYTYSNVVSINYLQLSTVRIFPNPVGDVLSVSIQSEKAQAATFTISDIAGKNIYTEKRMLSLGNNTFSINAHQLPKGTYTLMVNGAKTWVQNFVKQ